MPISLDDVFGVWKVFLKNKRESNEPTPDTQDEAKRQQHMNKLQIKILSTEKQ